MNRRALLTTGATVAALSTAGCSDMDGADTDGNDEGDESPDDAADSADDTDTDDAADNTDGFEIETVAEGFENPWGMVFLPGESLLLVTELGGELNLVNREDGTVESIEGTPEVYAEGQGGLLDVALHPEFPDEPWVYLTYAVTNDDDESATQLGRGQLDTETGELAGFEELFTAEPFIEDDGHFGSRIVFGEDGMLYMTTGDRQRKDFGEDHVSQDTTHELGATLRLAPDGSIPDDNPFIDDSEVTDAIYSYGHRNAQAMTVHPETGELWQGEHGEEDGDEINIIEEGGNHGWPVATYACEYGTEDPVGDEPPEREDTVAPVYYWECPDPDGGFPPSGATFYDGEAFPDWQGNLFMGTLAGAYLGQFSVNGEDVEELDPLLADEGWRIRAVEVAPDTGHLYIAVDEADAPIVRLIPE
jgi:glucose/arabinose dehydrogenase